MKYLEVTFIFFLFLALGRFSHASELLINGVENTTVWTVPDVSKGEDYSKKASINLHFSTKVKPLRFTVKPAAQSGMSYIIEFKHNPNPNESYAVRLPVDLICDAEINDILFDENNEILEGAYLQIAEHDFIGDGIPEVIIAAGDGATYMCMNIFQYNPPALETENENWKLIGKFSGQDKAAIDGQTILFKHGSRGFEEDVICKKNKCFNIAM
jgi:hypothetical protein